MISQQLHDFFKLLAKFNKLIDGFSANSPWEKSEWEEIENFDESQFSIKTFDIKQTDQESLLDYYERLRAHKNLVENTQWQLKIYVEKINEFRRRFHQKIALNEKFTAKELRIFKLQVELLDKVEQTESKLKSLKDKVKGCNLILLSRYTNLNNLNPPEGYLFLKTDGNYKSRYKQHIHEGSLSDTNPSLKIPHFSNLPLDSDLVQSVLSITSQKNHSAKRTISEIKTEIAEKIEVIPNSITLGIWYSKTVEETKTLFGYPSLGHITLDICDSHGKSHYFSLYTADNLEHTLLTDWLHLPSYKSVAGILERKETDILNLINNSKYLEHQKVVFKS